MAAAPWDVAIGPCCGTAAGWLGVTIGGGCNGQEAANGIFDVSRSESAAQAAVVDVGGVDGDGGGCGGWASMPDNMHNWAQ